MLRIRRTFHFDIVPFAGYVCISPPRCKNCPLRRVFTWATCNLRAGMMFEMITELKPEPTEQSAQWDSILVIEDDRSQCEALEFRLTRQGFDVHVTHTGRSGLEIARHSRPRLALVDLRLPDMDGFAVCEALGDDPATCDVPVILLSGMEGPDIVRRARQAGCRYFLRKPYDPNALLALILAALSDAA